MTPIKSIFFWQFIINAISFSIFLNRSKSNFFSPYIKILFIFDWIKFLSTGSIEDDLRSIHLFFSLSHQLANLFCGGDVPAASSLPRGFGRRSRHKCHALPVVNDLGVDMVQASIHREPWTGGGARNLISDSLVNRLPYFLACLSSHCVHLLKSED